LPEQVFGAYFKQKARDSSPQLLLSMHFAVALLLLVAETATAHMAETATAHMADAPTSNTSTVQDNLANASANSTSTTDDLTPTNKNALAIYRPSVVHEQLQELFEKEKVFDLEKLGRRIHITQEWGAGGTGAASWLAGYVLAQFLTRFVDLVADTASQSQTQYAELLGSLQEHGDDTEQWGWRRKQVVELGAGLGLSSITAALMGANVVATDGDAAILPLARANIVTNLGSCTDGIGAGCADGNASVKLLQWSKWAPEELLASIDLESPPQIVMGADIVYGEDRKVWRNLVNTLDALCGPRSVVILAQTTRYDTESIFFRMLFARFEHMTVDRKFLHPSHRSIAAMTVYVLWKKH
jgi:2-polyprenyl-3-methyl-5-hydroxy-6-metoxy-1,4-benzoquinol methylase